MDRRREPSDNGRVPPSGLIRAAGSEPEPRLCQGRLQRRLIERAAGPPENGTIPLRLKKSLRLGRWAPESGDAAKGWLVA
jgi:hypothetical protein